MEPQGAGRAQQDKKLKPKYTTFISQQYFFINQDKSKIMGLRMESILCNRLQGLTVALGSPETGTHNVKSGGYPNRCAVTLMDTPILQQQSLYQVSIGAKITLAARLWIPAGHRN